MCCTLYKALKNSTEIRNWSGTGDNEQRSRCSAAACAGRDVLLWIQTLKSSFVEAIYCEGQ